MECSRLAERQCGESVECPICLCVIEKDDPCVIIATCCNHPFHMACHVQCMNIKKECPLCRAFQYTVTHESTTLDIPSMDTIHTPENVDIPRVPRHLPIRHSIVTVHHADTATHSTRTRKYFYIPFVFSIGLYYIVFVCD